MATDKGASLAFLVAQYLDFYPGAKSTVAAKQLDLKALTHALPAGAHLEELDGKAVERFLNARLAAGKAPATVCRELATFKAFAAWVEDEIPEYRNTVKRVKGPKLPEPKYQALTDGQLAALLEVSARGRGFVDIRNHLLIMLLVETGLRCNEAASLNLESYDQASQTLANVRCKGMRYRDVVVSCALARALADYLPARENLLGARDSAYPALRDYLKGKYPLLVSWHYAKPGAPETYRIHKRSIYGVVRSSCRAAGIKPELCHPHTLRHTFCRRLLDSCHDIAVVAEAAGHSDVKTTMRYTKHTQQEIRDAINGITRRR